MRVYPVHNDSDIIGKVKDHGIGISKGIFLIYGNGFIVRINPEQEEVTAGSSLSMVKWIAEAHG